MENEKLSVKGLEMNRRNPIDKSDTFGSREEGSKQRRDVDWEVRSLLSDLCDNSFCTSELLDID